jgi:hypothetical protein
MPVSKVRKPLAFTALLASSAVGTVLAGADAHATTYGDAGLPNPVSVMTSDGTLHQIDAAGAEIGAIHLPGAHAAWSGQGGRVAYVANGAIFTADSDGSHTIRIANVPGGAEVPMLTWDAFSRYVIWPQGLGGDEQLMFASANGDDLAAGARTLVDQATMTKAGIKSIDALDVAGDAGGSIVVQTWDGSANGQDIKLLTYANGAWSFTPVATAGSPTVSYTQPTISPDGSRIVYVSGGQLYLATRNTSSNTWNPAVPVTFAAGTRSNPVFTVDGKTVAFEFQAQGGTSTVTSTVDVTQATASANPSEKQLTKLSGELAVRADVRSVVSRFAGGDRFDTAIQASTALWRNKGDKNDTHRAQAQAVVLARSDIFADALGGAGLAGAKQGPLLLTDTKSLNSATQTEIQRILPGGGTVYVLGGESAIAPAVVSKLGSLGYQVQRIGGKDRYQTAAFIAGQAVDVPTRILVATGDNYPDALSAGAVAASHPGTVVLLSDNAAMPQATEAYLEDMDTRSNHQLNVWGIGHQGASALSSAGWTGTATAAGADRYATSLLVARDFFTGPDTIAVATGANFPDALSAGAFLGRFWGPLLLVDPQAGLAPAAAAWIDSERGSTSAGFVFGGTGALPRSVDGQLGAEISTATGVSIGNFTGSLAVHVASGPAEAKAATGARTEAAKH